MGTLKGLSRSDVFLTDYNSQKEWSIPAENARDLGIKAIKVYSGSLHWNGLFQQYYSGSNPDGSVTGSVDLNFQTTITVEGVRRLPSNDEVIPPDIDPSVTVVTFPKDLFGVILEPGQLKLTAKEDAVNYVEDDYMLVESSSVIDGVPGIVVDKDPYYFEDLRIISVRDEDGVLIASGYTGQYEYREGWEYPVPVIEPRQFIGDVMYNQGLFIVTNPFWSYIFSKLVADGERTGEQFSFLKNLEWMSNVPIFTYNISCLVRDHEFNCTYNVTAKPLNGSEDFTPYITSIGLYNNRNELLAVAKLSKPLRKLDNIDMTFNIRVDIS